LSRVALKRTKSRRCRGTPRKDREHLGLILWAPDSQGLKSTDPSGVPLLGWPRRQADRLRAQNHHLDGGGTPRSRSAEDRSHGAHQAKTLDLSGGERSSFTYDRVNTNSVAHVLLTSSMRAIEGTAEACLPTAAGGAVGRQARGRRGAGDDVDREGVWMPPSIVASFRTSAWPRPAT